MIDKMPAALIPAAWSRRGSSGGAEPLPRSFPAVAGVGEDAAGSFMSLGLSSRPVAERRISTVLTCGCGVGPDDEPVGFVKTVGGLAI
jgi:hypothetical protein